MSMTLEELLALLPDNTSGQIGADDLRTIVTELYPFIVADEGAPLANRPKLNFTGSGVSVTDDAVNDATKVAIEPQPALDTKITKVVNLTTPGSSGMQGDWTVGYATTGTSPTLLNVWYNPAGTAYNTFWLNENGAPRAAMGKAADCALKVIGWGTGQSVNTFQVEKYSGSGTGGRNPVFAIDVDGAPRLGASNVKGAWAVVIASSDSAPPAGTPAGTIVVKLRP